MAATTATKAPFAGFANASPAQLRAVIVPEDQPTFDEQYRAALTSAADTLSLDELEDFLEHWRRRAWSQADMGHDRWRAMLARAERVLATGEAPPGTASEEEIEELLRAKLGR